MVERITVCGAAAVFNCLGEPTRLQLFAELVRSGEQSIAELAKRVGCSRAVAGNHLTKLRQRGLVVDRRRGGQCFYRVAREYPQGERGVAALRRVWPEGL